ncbi:hypothetical protein vseg_013040 [Gypsophila vaccaria]
MLYSSSSFSSRNQNLRTLHIPFSGEEGFGKYLDLHEFHRRYTNSKFGHYVTYIDYLRTFPGTDDDNVIPSKFKATLEYRLYVKDVLEYLISFMDRARPLTFLDRIFKELEEQSAGCNLDRGKKRQREPEIEGLIRDANTVDDLMEMGLDNLKEALDTLGLKSGGTLRQRAERLLQAKNQQVDQRHLKKEQLGGKETALVEAKVRKLCEILSDTLEQTRHHVQNKQAMTPRERQKDDEDQECDEENDVESDDDDNDGDKIYNPLKLPKGWDGKPIPYWLYKLHGLDQNFECEICGDRTYSGRRDYENHFKGARHQHGLRCLGVTNSYKSFHEITSIQDARNLWEHIQLKQGLSKWRPEVDEEFEDADGNVYDKKTFTYLARQGLI